MKNLKRSILVLFAILLMGNIAFSQSYDYENMDMDAYKAELAKWQQRESQAKMSITSENVVVDSLQKQLVDLDKDISGIKDETYALMNTEKEGYDKFGEDVDKFQNDVSSFAAMTPEEIYKNKDEIAKLKQQLDEYSNDPRSASTENQTKVARISNLIAQAESKMSNIAAGMYTVMRGDYLWKIAKKSDVYGDPFAWLRIYNSNKDKIKDPNLIYTNQVFSIPRIVGANEHLVTRGQTLSSIAGLSGVYGSPFKWMKLYNSNKDQIQDPNYILPYWVLKIDR